MYNEEINNYKGLNLSFYCTMNCTLTKQSTQDKSVINIFFLSLKFNSTYIQFKNKVICRLYKCSDQIKFNRVLKQFNDNSFDFYSISKQGVNLAELLYNSMLFNWCEKLFNLRNFMWNSFNTKKIRFVTCSTLLLSSHL